MWQRLQTLFLLLGIISLAGLFFVPFKEFMIGESSGKLMISDYTPQMIVAIAAMVLMAINITRFSNRGLQMKIGFVTVGVLLVLFFWLFFTKAEGTVDKIQFDFGILFPIAALLLNNFAIRFIWRDEKMVRSMDRLR